MGKRGPMSALEREQAIKKALERGRGRPLEPSPPEFVKPTSSWHPIARDMWDAALCSEVACSWQATDWASLKFLCSELSDYSRGTRKSAQRLQAIMAGLQGLLLLPGARVKARATEGRSGMSEDDVAALVRDHEEAAYERGRAEVASQIRVLPAVRKGAAS